MQRANLLYHTISLLLSCDRSKIFLAEISMSQHGLSDLARVFTLIKSRCHVQSLMALGILDTYGWIGEFVNSLEFSSVYAEELHSK